MVKVSPFYNFEGEKIYTVDLGNRIAKMRVTKSPLTEEDKKELTKEAKKYPFHWKKFEYGAAILRKANGSVVTIDGVFTEEEI